MKKFEYQFKVLESHLDTFGHVNNATYLALFEEARWDLITKRGWGLDEIKAHGIGPVLLEANIKFKKEVKNREVIKVISQCGEAINKLVMSFHQEMVREEGTVVATLDIRVGLMDLKKRQLIEPTAQWRRAIGLD